MDPACGTSGFLVAVSDYLKENRKQEVFFNRQNKDHYAPRIRRQNQLLVWNAAPNPITAIRGIEKRAKEFIEETGVNVAYLAFGFIHWRESEASREVYQAPVLLVPVQLERESAISPYWCTMDIQINLPGHKKGSIVP